jgi:hypothetical protein
VVGIDRVHVERDVEEGGAGRVRERLAHARLDADPVDLAHREDLRVELAEQLPLAVVERADADERELPRLHRRQLPAVAPERLPAEPERGCQHHPVHVAGRRGVGRVQVAVCVDPDDAAGTAHLRHPDERAERDGMVAAEDERERAASRRRGDEARDLLADVEDLVEEARVLAADRFRLDDRRAHVSLVGDRDAELLRQVLLELRVADRRRAHVDAAPARAEVERRADHRDLPEGLLDAHARKANAPAWRASALRVPATLTAASAR